MGKLVLGADISLTSFGWFIQGCKEYTYGSFKTKPSDGLTIERLMLQRDRFADLVKKYKIKRVCIEQPLKMTFNTELLFALHQFVFEVCYTKNIDVVYITPAQIKQYVTGDFKAGKGEVVFATKRQLKLEKRINNDECDAYWVGKIGSRFWNLLDKKITEKDLSDKEKLIFIKTKSKKKGLIYKPNESFFIFQ